MAAVTCKKQEAVIVARSSGSEQLLKVTVTAIQGDKVTLEFDVGASESVHAAEEWEQSQAARKNARMAHGMDRPKHRAPYSD